MKCNNKCEHWYINLKVSRGVGPMCKKHGLPISEAKEYCLMDAEERRTRLNKSAKKGTDKQKKITAKPWPGSLRGWGPITKDTGI